MIGARRTGKKRIASGAAVQAAGLQLGTSWVNSTTSPCPDVPAANWNSTPLVAGTVVSGNGFLVQGNGFVTFRMVNRTSSTGTAFGRYMELRINGVNWYAETANEYPMIRTTPPIEVYDGQLVTVGFAATGDISSQRTMVAAATDGTQIRMGPV